MNLRLDLPQSLETTLKAQATAAGKEIEAFVTEILELALSQSSVEPKASVSHEQFSERLQRVIDLHPRGNASMDDSRESIYAGRDE
ncbi:MAG: hypothetical protein ABL921_24655 [Pirellula sp.]